MNFEFTEDQRLLRNAAIEFCEKEVLPNIEEWFAERKFPRDLVKKCAEIGWMGACVPEELGGMGLSQTELGILSEVMGMYEVPAQIFLTIHLAGLLIHLNDEDLREKLISRLVRGDLVICGAFTEPGCGSDAAAITTKATKKDDTYVVNGEKSFVSGPGFSDVYIATARTDENATRPQEGISLILIERDRKGVEPYNLTTMCTEFEGDFGGVYFTNTEVPVGHLVGIENAGFKLLMQEFTTIRVHVALMGLGLAERCLNESIEYAKQRRAFGQPISKFQAVSFRIAESWTKVQAAKLLAYKALHLADAGKPYLAESSATKWYGCEVAFNVINDALQTLGAAGYTTEFMFERALRRARGLLIGDGTSDIQKLIISRILFGREFV